MRKKLSLFGVVLSVLLCSSLVVAVDAASIWSRTYGGAGDEEANSVVETSDGGYVIVGYTTSVGAGSTDAWLVKTDADGSMEWNRTYGGASVDNVQSLVATSDGGYALVGFTGLVGVGEGRGFWFVKTDSNGFMEWNRTYLGAGNAGVCSMVVASDGGYVIAGGSLLIKIDASGNMEWNRTIGRAYNTTYQWLPWDSVYSLVATNDGGYAMAGTFNNVAPFSARGGVTPTAETVSTEVIAADSSSTKADFWLVKTDALGYMLWNKTYGETAEDYGYSLVATSDGGFAIAGSTWSLGAGITNSSLIKTDSNGAMEWNRTYVETALASLVEAPDGGYALAGSFVNATDPLSSDFCLVKTDAFGNMVWKRTYHWLEFDTARSLIATSDGGYAMAGWTGEVGGNGDFWLVKTDELGVAPEFSSWLVPAIVLTATAFIIINKKKLLRRSS